MTKNTIEEIKQTWIAQGRTPEQIWAVENFLSGAGKDLVHISEVQKARVEVIEKVLDIIHEVDPSSNRTTSPAYWGNVLREKINSLSQ